MSESLGSYVRFPEYYLSLLYGYQARYQKVQV